MPVVDSYRYLHPWATPEPHFLPGYTGYLPGYGPRRRYQMAQTYGHMTHDIMSSHHMAGWRLAPILDDEENYLRETENSYLVKNRYFENSDLKLREDILPGYTGYIPRSIYHLGKTYTPGSKEAIAEFEKIQKSEGNDTQPLSLPPQDILPGQEPLPELRPHARNRWANDCKWAQFPNYGQYSQSPYTMSDLTSNMEYPSGFSGCHAESGRYNPGVICTSGVNEDLCDFTNYCIERRLARKRPSIHDWYQDSSMNPSDAVRSSSCNRHCERREEPQPGYTGFVPGYLSSYGSQSGKAAQNFMRDHDMKFYSGLRDRQMGDRLCNS